MYGNALPFLNAATLFIALSCKEKTETISHRATTLVASLQAQETECKKTKGAEWNTAHQVCVKPYTLAMCRKANKSFVWDGIGCVSQNKVKNFYRWCIDLSAPESVKQTVRIITQKFQGSTCQAVNTALVEKESFTLQGESLVDLTPFQGWEGLKHLDLWNNKIVDVSPLKYLQNLETLNLGHNEISDASPLASLKKLKELYLFENALYDVTALGTLTGLQVLDLRKNRIQDFSPVEALGVKSLMKEGNVQPIDL
ncbi:MAG: leucine-rich repeat domain-containing protein [Deltaproteobacteria bacterium]|nr:leucine-rich repeat domain-containing protein [Deltaproteobacteria bacterium]